MKKRRRIAGSSEVFHRLVNCSIHLNSCGKPLNDSYKEFFRNTRHHQTADRKVKCSCFASAREKGTRFSKQRSILMTPVVASREENYFLLQSTSDVICHSFFIMIKTTPGRVYGATSLTSRSQYQIRDIYRRSRLWIGRNAEGSFRRRFLSTFGYRRPSRTKTK